MGYFRILTAIPGFFLGALFLMLLWNVVGPQVGLGAISYPTAMLVNITLWLAVAEPAFEYAGGSGEFLISNAGARRAGGRLGDVGEGDRRRQRDGDRDHQGEGGPERPPVALAGSACDGGAAACAAPLPAESALASSPSVGRLSRSSGQDTPRTTRIASASICRR